MPRTVGQGSRRITSRGSRPTSSNSRANGKRKAEESVSQQTKRPRRRARAGSFNDEEPATHKTRKAVRSTRKVMPTPSESDSDEDEEKDSAEEEQVKETVKRTRRTRAVVRSPEDDEDDESNDDESNDNEVREEEELSEEEEKNNDDQDRVDNEGSESGEKAEEGDEDDESREEENEDEEPEIQRVRPRSKRSAVTNRSNSASERNARMQYYFVKNIDTKKFRQEEALARFRYLLGLGDLFLRFVDYRAQRDPSFKALLDQAQRDNQKAQRASARGPTKSRGKKAGPLGSHRSHRGDDPALMDDEDEKITVFSESPGFVKGKLRQYQIDGLNWLVSLFQNKINGILADEMGLGKTFQCISFLAYLRHIQNISGPHLVIIPKSTLQNWAREFAKWTPEVEVLVVTGSKEERAELIKDRLLSCKFDVCITSFELVIREKSALQKIAWQYVIVDEAHRIKNEESILSKIMRVLFSRHRLLITGTPLQNNLHELWALLNFLLPDVFSDADVFDDWFTQKEKNESSESEAESDNENENKKEIENKKGGQNEGQNGHSKKGVGKPKEKHNSEADELVNQLRSLLSPFLLRRVKNDVEHTLLPKKEINLYAPMTEMQLEWYQRLLIKDLDAVNNIKKGASGRDGKMRLLNVVMQLRKCCNHPYLFDGAEPGPPFTTDEHLVRNSSKMLILDKLLAHLKEKGSRVLIFSQMSKMLDILEDYCALRDYEYCRIDGSTVHEDRVSAIDEFNKPGSDKFLFLLTTRAGGLGINLTTADQVVIYDSDWNPQADLQAMDRAHRIGQTKQVWVYRLVIENAIEEKILERAAHKLRLDQLVIQQGGSGRNNGAEKAANAREELANMIRHGAQDVFDQKVNTSSDDFNISDIISAGEVRTKQLNDKYSDLGLDELQKFTFDKPPSNQLQVSSNLNKVAFEDDYRHHHYRRARNHAIYHDELTMNEADGRPVKPGTLRAPKQIPLHDFQFYPPELHALQVRELASYRKLAGIRLSPEDYSSDEEDESDERNAEIESAEPLTEEEYAHKEELIAQGFPNFTKRDFYHFISLLSTHENPSNLSNEALDELCESWPEKPASEIKRYYKVFFERYKEIVDYERYMNQIVAGGNKAKRNSHRVELLKKRIQATHNPLSNMPVSQPTGGSASRYRFSESNDRFMLIELTKIGIETPNVFQIIHSRIRTCGLFDFDWYFMTRTPVEIGRRCSSLLNIIAKENEGILAPKGTKRKGRPPNNSKDPQTSSRRVKEDSVTLD